LRLDVARLSFDKLRTNGSESGVDRRAGADDINERHPFVVSLSNHKAHRTLARADAQA
jgi:hypothetical protein